MFKDFILNAVCYVTAALIGGAMFIGGVIILGMIIEGVGERDQQHDQCLKHATNGYEIRECH